jgi:acetate CoA/acetoacetate CoA-transferase alpha subunit
MRTISAEQSVAIIPDGASLMIGGFMGVGTPERLIDELVRRKPRNLTVIANDTASPGRGIGKLVEAKLVRKAIVSHIGLNPETQRQMMAGELEVELVPQGTLIERIRAGGHGLGGVLTQTGIGTPVETGKRRIDLDGKSYLLETALRADFALVQAFLADYARACRRRDSGRLPHHDGRFVLELHPHGSSRRALDEEGRDSLHDDLLRQPDGG